MLMMMKNDDHDGDDDDQYEDENTDKVGGVDGDVDEDNQSDFLVTCVRLYKSPGPSVLQSIVLLVTFGPFFALSHSKRMLDCSLGAM